MVCSCGAETSRRGAMQMNGKDFAWGSLNTLCWAIGSISGSMAEEQENRYTALCTCSLVV